LINVRLKEGLSITVLELSFKKILMGDEVNKEENDFSSNASARSSVSTALGPWKPL